MIKAPLRSRSSVQPNLSASGLLFQIDRNRFSAFAHTWMLSTGGRKFGSLSRPFFSSPASQPWYCIPIESIFPLRRAWKPRKLFLAGRACYKTEESVYGGLGLSPLFLPSDWKSSFENEALGLASVGVCPAKHSRTHSWVHMGPSLITQHKAFTLDLLFNFLIWISGR